MLKIERIFHYERALELLTIGNVNEVDLFMPISWYKESSGICELLSLSICNNLTANYDNEWLEMFPEFKLFKPDFNEDGSFWWDKNERELRMYVLEFCILMAQDSKE